MLFGTQNTGEINIEAAHLEVIFWLYSNQVLAFCFFLTADLSRSSPWIAMWETWVRSLGREDPLEKEMATHSSILANLLQYSCLENPMDGGAWWATVHGVAMSWTRLSDFTFIFHFDALEKEMTTHSSVLAWRIPGTGEPGGLPSMGSHRVRRN